MEVRQISGCTRTIGRSQGYIGLPLRDVVINDSVTGPKTPAMESAWRPSASEIADLKEGGVVILRVIGKAHPPVMLYVGAEPMAAEAIDHVTRAEAIEIALKGVDEILSEADSLDEARRMFSDLLKLQADRVRTLKASN